MKKNHLPKNVSLNPNSRRMFLRSAGGLALAIPFLPSLASLVLSEKAMAEQVNAIRYVGVRTALGGLQHKNWAGPNLPTQNFELYPGRNARRGLISSLAGADGISPIFNANFQSLFPYMNLILGADNPSYLGHNLIVGSGATPLSGSDQRNLTGQGGLVGENCSIDQVMANFNRNGIYGKNISGRTRHINISHGGSGESFGRDDYESKSEVKVKELVYGTSSIFQTLFGSVSENNVTNGQAYTNPLLNLVNEFWSSGKSLIQKLSAEDRRSLDQFFQLAQQASDDYYLPGPQCPNAKTPSTGNEMADIAALIAMAFKCDLTRVVTIDVSPEINGLNWHSFSHLAYDKGPDAGQSEIVQLVSNIAQNFILKLGNNLNVADPLNSSQSLLTNSIVKWTHENKCAHDTYSLPLMLMGAGGGRINTGYVTDLRDLTTSYGVDAVGDSMYKGDLLNRLWSSLFYTMNVPKSAYEFARGGGYHSLVLDKGFGHVLKSYESWLKTPRAEDYDISKIGDPWEFLRRQGVAWG